MTPDKLSERYREGYRLSTWINYVGETVAGAGICLGIAFIYFVTKLTPSLLSDLPMVTSWITDIFHLSFTQQEGIVFLLACVLAFGLIVVSTVIGTIISGTAQVVRAVIDTAVNTSPLLSTEEKGDIMEGSWWKDLLKAVRRR